MYKRQPEEVYLKPANAFVYDFLGHYNEFDGWQLSDGSLLLNEDEPLPAASHPTVMGPAKKGLLSKLPILGDWIAARQTDPVVYSTRPHNKGRPLGTKVKLFCRPHELQVKRDKEPGTVPAQLIHINPAGSLVKLELEREDGSLLDAELPRSEFESLAPKRGDKLFVRPTHTKIFA